MNQRRKLLGTRRGFSLMELLIVIAIILIIITMAVPKFNQARRFANETGAIRAIQTIHTAQVQYQSQYGRYANSLAELGPPQTGNPSPAAADLIHSDLASGDKGGYKYVVAGGQGRYTVTAVPTTFGTTGARTFFSDETMVIRENYTQDPATVSSPEINTAASGNK